MFEDSMKAATRSTAQSPFGSFSPIPALRLIVLALAAGVVSLPCAASVLITTSDVEIDLQAHTGQRLQTGHGGLSQRGGQPSSDDWFVPYFVVDTNSGIGETTLVTIRNEQEVGVVDVSVQFYDKTFSLFHFENIALVPNEIRSFNLRDQPALVVDAMGMAEGFVQIATAGLISVDQIRVDPGDNFATGSIAPVFGSFCETWKVRVLDGAGFTGGTRVTFLIDGPLGEDPTDDPTVMGNLYNEAGAFLSSFTIRSADWAFEVDAADLIPPSPATLGAFEIVLVGSVSSEGWVSVTHSAEGRFSIGFPGVCRDNVPIP